MISACVFSYFYAWPLLSNTHIDLNNSSNVYSLATFQFSAIILKLQTFNVNDLSSLSSIIPVIREFFFERVRRRNCILGYCKIKKILRSIIKEHALRNENSYTDTFYKSSTKYYFSFVEANDRRKQLTRQRPFQFSREIERKNRKEKERKSHVHGVKNL